MKDIYYKIQWNILRNLIASEMNSDKTETLRKCFDWMNTIESVVIKYESDGDYILCYAVFLYLIFSEIRFNEIEEAPNYNKIDILRRVSTWQCRMNIGCKEADKIKSGHYDC